MYIPLTFEGALQKCLSASSSLQGTFVSGGVQYGFHRIISSGSFEVFNGSLQAQLLVVGGGGGGGTVSAGNASGGGGGGQVKYFPTQQFYAGTYNIVIGAGGAEGGGIGGTTTITGPGVSVSSIGGSGSITTTGGTSGDGFSGGTGCSNVKVGGGGGGSRGAAQNENCGAPQQADGGIGFDISMADYLWSYGCGGGGGGSDSSYRGISCFGGDGFGAPTGSAGGQNTGNGGGGSWSQFANTMGGAGGSGIVVIQYPIEEYCKNFYNETGSCGCRQLTLDITGPAGFGYSPNQTGSYIYMPCGGDRFVSGSLIAYSPLTVCAVSNSYYSITSESGFGGGVGFTTSGPECVSASLTPVACSPEAFVATCTSSIVTIYTPSASVGNPIDFGYVAKNETTHSIYTTTTDRVKYLCISTGSLFNGNQIYPKVLTGNFATLYNTASCNTTTFQSTAAFPANRFYSYYNCNGAKVSGQFTGPGSVTVCIDRSAPFGFTGTTSGTSTTIGGDCLSGSFDTGSCGCP